MNDSISSAMSTLKNSADKLNSLTDEAAATIKSVENFLSKECSIGFNKRVRLEDENFSTRYLEYRRIGSNFRIAVTKVTSISMMAEKEDTKAWSDCSRELKLESITKLPDLIIAITKRVEEEIAKAQEATSTASHVLNSLTGKEDK